MKKRVTRQIQKPIKGKTRRQMTTRVRDRIEKFIEREAAFFNVSRSFVIANACAIAFGIDLYEDYKKPKVVRKKA